MKNLYEHIRIWLPPIMLMGFMFAGYLYIKHDQENDFIQEMQKASELQSYIADSCNKKGGSVIVLLSTKDVVSGCILPPTRGM